MALPLPAGLTPPEIAFLCEMELVTISPRQRLEGLDLLGVRYRPSNTPHAHVVQLHSVHLRLYIHSHLGSSQTSRPAIPYEHSSLACLTT